MTIVWLSLVLKYFTIDHKKLNLETMRSCLGRNFSKKLSFLVMVSYFGTTVYLDEKRIDSLIFGATVYVLTDFGSRYSPKSFTFSELLTLATLITVYTSFLIKQVVRPIPSSVGNQALNVAMFVPWASLLLFLASLWILKETIGRLIGIKTSTLSLLLMPFVPPALIAYYLSDDKLFSRLSKVILGNGQMIGYLALVLTIGLALLYDLSRPVPDQLLKLGNISRLTHRKLFHLLGFALYTPMHARVIESRRMFEFLVLS